MQRIHACFVVSGGGTTMQAILDATRGGVLDGYVYPKLVIATRPGIGAIDKALKWGMPQTSVIVLPPKQLGAEAFAKRMIDECFLRGVNFVGLYGCLTRIPLEVVTLYEGRMINQHPGPLSPQAPPGYDFGGDEMYGMRVHAARLYFTQVVQRDPWSTATAHRVTPKYDRGQIVGEEMVAIYSGDTPERLQKRMLPVEHRLHVKVLRQFVEGTVEPIEHAPHWLVKPGEEWVLNKSKELAIQAYRKG